MRQNFLDQQATEVWDSSGLPISVEPKEVASMLEVVSMGSYSPYLFIKMGTDTPSWAQAMIMACAQRSARKRPQEVEIGVFDWEKKSYIVVDSNCPENIGVFFPDPEDPDNFFFYGDSEEEEGEWV